MFSPTVNSAEQYASAGMGEEWVRNYLNSINENMPDISDHFMSELVKIPLRLIDFADTGETEPEAMGAFEVPLIVIYDQRKFFVPYQPEYLSQLRKEKRNSHYAFVFAKNDDYGYFWNNYGKHFQK